MYLNVFVAEAIQTAWRTFLAQVQGDRADMALSAAAAVCVSPSPQEGLSEDEWQSC